MARTNELHGLARPANGINGSLIISHILRFILNRISRKKWWGAADPLSGAYVAAAAVCSGLAGQQQDDLRVVSQLAAS